MQKFKIPLTSLSCPATYINTHKRPVIGSLLLYLPPFPMPEMYSQNRIPVKVTPEPPPLKRHHTARYYGHRVRESLTTRISKIICTIFLGLLLFLGITAFILWLNLRPHRPRFHVQEFSIPGLTQENGFENATITFNVSTRNANHNIGIHYDSMDSSVYYKDQRIGGTPLLFPFYQQPKNTTVVFGVLSGPTLTVNSQRWMEFMTDRAAGVVAFRLELTSTIRFKLSAWDSKRHRMHANCNVQIGQDGLLSTPLKERRCPVYFSW